MNTATLISEQTLHSDEEFQNKQVIEKMVDAFVRHDLDDMMVLFADQCVYQDMSGGGINGKCHYGKEAIRHVFQQQIKLLPKHTFTDPIIIVSGNKAHANWTLILGDEEKPLYKVRGCDYFELENGLITLKTAWLKNHIRFITMAAIIQLRELIT